MFRAHHPSSCLLARAATSYASKAGATASATAASLNRRRSGDSVSVLETFMHIQLGTWAPTAQSARHLLANHFAPKMTHLHLNEAKLAAMDPKKVTRLLKQALYEQYLAVPFTVLSFDLEFTGIPTFDEEGVPSEDIVEIALYDPDRKELFQQLVQPYNRNVMTEQAATLTGITDAMLFEHRKKEQQIESASSSSSSSSSQFVALPLVEAWNKAVDFIEASMIHEARKRQAQKVQQDMFASSMLQAGNMMGGGGGGGGGGFGRSNVKSANKSNGTSSAAADAEKKEDDLLRQRLPSERLLLLSHGAKLADSHMVNWIQTLPGAKKLPTPNTTYGDTLLQIKDLHRRRPVTKDKWPAAWSLEDIAIFLGLSTQSLHRAGPDAILTWDALYHTLDRYGDESLTPRQQLVGRFYDNEAKGILGQLDEARSALRGISRQQQQQSEQEHLSAVDEARRRSVAANKSVEQPEEQREQDVFARSDDSKYQISSPTFLRKERGKGVAAADTGVAVRTPAPITKKISKKK